MAAFTNFDLKSSAANGSMDSKHPIYNMNGMTNALQFALTETGHDDEENTEQAQKLAMELYRKAKAAQKTGAASIDIKDMRMVATRAVNASDGNLYTEAESFSARMIFPGVAGAENLKLSMLCASPSYDLVEQDPYDASPDAKRVIQIDPATTRPLVVRSLKSYDPDTFIELDCFFATIRPKMGTATDHSAPNVTHYAALKKRGAEYVSMKMLTFRVFGSTDVTRGSRRQSICIPADTAAEFCCIDLAGWLKSVPNNDTYHITREVYVRSNPKFNGKLEMKFFERPVRREMRLVSIAGFNCMMMYKHIQAHHQVFDKSSTKKNDMSAMAMNFIPVKNSQEELIRSRMEIQACKLEELDQAPAAVNAAAAATAENIRQKAAAEASRLVAHHAAKHNARLGELLTGMLSSIGRCPPIEALVDSVRSWNSETGYKWEEVHQRAVDDFAAHYSRLQTSYAVAERTKAASAAAAAAAAAPAAAVAAASAYHAAPAAAATTVLPSASGLAPRMSDAGLARAGDADSDASMSRHTKRGRPSDSASAK